MSEPAVEYTDEADRRKRVTFEQRPLGDWTRRLEEKRRGKWRTVGTETVVEVEFLCGEGVTKVGP